MLSVHQVLKKNTFSRSLKDLTEFPLFYLVMVDFYSDGTEIPRDEFNMKLNEILKQEECIIDGSYLRTHELRIKYCDIIFFIEFQIDLCLMNSESRIGKEREDLP